MHVVIGFLCGVLGMLAGWFGLAMLVISLAGQGHDGGGAMAAFFQVGPFGGLVGFALAVWLFVRLAVPARASHMHEGQPLTRPSRRARSGTS